MATVEENRKELNKICLNELRRVLDNAAQSFRNIQPKALALLTAEIALSAFLFSSTSGHNSFFVGRVPAYGFVLFGVGIGLLLTSALLFLSCIAPAGWTIPPEERDIADLYGRFNDEPLKFLEYLKTEYMQSIGHCIRIVDERSQRFSYGVYAFSFGTALLVLVKYCGGIIKL